MPLIVDCKSQSAPYWNRDNITTAYLEDIRKYPVLTHEQTIELFKKYRYGNKVESEKAKNRLVECNQRFIVSVARKMSYGNDMMDLVSEANIGLMEAIENYDIKKNIKFMTYAIFWIRKYIIKYLAQSRSVVAPYNADRVATYVNKVKNSFYLKNGRIPSCEEVNEILEENYNFTLPNEDITKPKYMSIDAPVSEELYYRNQEYEAKSSVSPFNDIMDREEECERVESLLSKLNDKESEIMRMLYGIGTEEMTINGVSEVVGLTGERVRQIRNDAITKLKAYIVKSK